MRFSKMFRFRKDSRSFIIAALLGGVVLAVGGSVLATSVGSSIGVTTDLTVSGNTGAGTTSPGTVFSIQGAGNFKVGTSTIYTDLLFPSFTATTTRASGVGTSSPSTLFSIQGVANFVPDATSTVYSRLSLPSFSATSTSATSTLSTGGFAIGTDQFVVQQNSGRIGIGTSTPGSLFSVHGIASWASDATSTLYSILRLPNFAATSTSATSTLSTGGLAVGTTQFVVQQNSGRVGIGTSTPGSLLGVHDVANFAVGATSTIYSGVALPNFTATSTTATTSVSTGGFRVGQAADSAAFVIQQSATTSVGVGTSTVRSHQFGVQGNALIGTTGTTTLLLTSSTASTGSCIQMRAASSSDMYRIYLGNPIASGGNFGTLGLIVEPGPCR